MTGTTANGMTGKRIVVIETTVTAIVQRGTTINAIRTISATEIGVTNIRVGEAEAVATEMIREIGAISTIDMIGKIVTAVEIARIREITTEIAITEDPRPVTGRENPAKIDRGEDLAREASLQLRTISRQPNQRLRSKSQPSPYPLDLVPVSNLHQ